MAFLFFIDEKKNTVLHPEAVKLHPVLSTLTEDEILFVVLAYDYCSPYAHFSEDDRVRRASLHVWSDNKVDILKKQKIKSAIDIYKGLQYNPKIDLVKAYQNKIDALNRNLETTNDAAGIEKTLKAQALLRKSIKELEQEVLEAYLEEGKIVGGGERTFLEKMQKNQELYKSIIKKKE